MLAQTHGTFFAAAFLREQGISIDAALRALASYGGGFMAETTKPSKESVREWLEQRTHAPLDPPPTPDEIRRQLGWHLLPQH